MSSSIARIRSWRQVAGETFTRITLDVRLVSSEPEVLFSVDTSTALHMLRTLPSHSCAMFATDARRSLHADVRVPTNRSRAHASTTAHPCVKLAATSNQTGTVVLYRYASSRCKCVDPRPGAVEIRGDAFGAAQPTIAICRLALSKQLSGMLGDPLNLIVRDPEHHVKTHCGTKIAQHA